MTEHVLAHSISTAIHLVGVANILHCLSPCTSICLLDYVNTHLHQIQSSSGLPEPTKSFSRHSSGSFGSSNSLVLLTFTTDNYTLLLLVGTFSFWCVGVTLYYTRGSGLVSSWQQSNGMLNVGGNTSTIRLWDVTREQCVRVYETKSQTCTTCIVSQSAQKSAPANGRRSSGGDSEDASTSFSWCFAGFADGSIGIYDQRIHTNGGRVGGAREHSSWIVNAFLRCDVPEVITGAVKGDVRFWDMRTMKTYKTIEVRLFSYSVVNVLGS